MDYVIDFAKVTSKGQITIPIDIRKRQRQQIQVRLELEEPVWKAWKTKKAREPEEED